MANTAKISNVTHTGDVIDAIGVLKVVKINNVALSGLDTGILKNTTSTGVPSIAIASDFPTLNQNTTGTAANITGIIDVINGGTGTTTPSLIGGTNVTISGTFPNQTINASSNVIGLKGDIGLQGIQGVKGDTGNDGLIISVNGITQNQGEITLTTTNINEGNNLYFTDVKVAANSSVMANTAKISNVTHTGDVIDAIGVLKVVKINNVALSGLDTGILKNTTSTGVPSIAIASDFPTLNQNTTGTAANITGIIDVINGGTGTTTPSLIGGTNVTISGTFPNQTINASSIAGGLKTSDGLKLTSTLKTISDNLNNNSPLKLSLTSITNNGSGNISSNTMFGEFSGYSNTSGMSNTFYGRSSGYNNTTGWGNTFIGAEAGYSNTIGMGNMCIGDQSGFYSTGRENMFIGNFSGTNSTGSRNIFIGYNSGNSNSTGGDNVFLGWYTGSANTIGESNTFIGQGAGKKSTSGYFNAFFGYHAGQNNTTGAKIVALGVMSNPLNYDDINEIIIGTSVTGKGSNTVTIGDAFIKNTYLNGIVSAKQFNVSDLSTPPTSSSDTGITGEIRYTSTGIFWCIATNSWIKVTGTTF